MKHVLFTLCAPIVVTEFVLLDVSTLEEIEPAVEAVLETILEAAVLVALINIVVTCPFVDVMIVPGGLDVFVEVATATTPTLTMAAITSAATTFRRVNRLVIRVST